jgi:hypothetical protein
MAARMMRPHTGAAIRPPEPSSVMVRGRSKPIHTAPSRRGVKPTNHASVAPLVVPVFPAAGMPEPSAARAAEPVPRSITLRIMLVTRNATPRSITRRRRTRARQTTLPSRSSTRVTKRGSTR